MLKLHSLVQICTVFSRLLSCFEVLSLSSCELLESNSALELWRNGGKYELF